MVSLSKREQQVMALLQEGFSSREIGEKLYISTKTVSFHLHNIYSKLRVKGRKQAVLALNRANGSVGGP